MPRIRTLQRHFARSPASSRISREARLFFILLWTEADDCGRLRLDHERPTRSRLPAIPHEAHEESPPMQKRRASKANPHEDDFFFEEVELPGTPGEFPPDRVLNILEIALRKSLSIDAQTVTARYVELAGRNELERVDDDNIGPSRVDLLSPPDRSA